MTIAAGFVCSDGLVLCADTEVTGAIKQYGRKVWFSGDKNFSLAIAGAGDPVLIKLARNRLFKKITTGASFDDAGQAFEEVLDELFSKHIDTARSVPGGDGHDVGLLLGIVNKEGHRLFEHSRRAVSDVDRYACIGAGTSVAGCVAEAIFERGMTTRWVRTLACYILQQAKQYALYCGGDSHVVVLSGIGPHLMPSPNVAVAEATIANLHAGLQPLLVSCCDIRSTDLDEQLARFRSVVEMARQRAIDAATVYAGGVYQAPNDDD